jgi:hypothetical protein
MKRNNQEICHDEILTHELGLKSRSAYHHVQASDLVSPSHPESLSDLSLFDLHEKGTINK